MSPCLFFRNMLAALFFSLCIAAQAQELTPVPPLQSRVTDLIGMLTPDQRQSLENTLKEYEAAKGSQIVVLLVNSTEPETIEQYSIRVVDTWKPGRKNIDDGVLLLVAKNNPPGLNRLRIESGRGTEGVLTDIQAKRILQDVIAPYFRQNDFYGGLSAGVSAIIATLNQETFAAPAEKTGEQSGGGSWLFILVMLVFIFAAMHARRRATFPDEFILGGNPSYRRQRSGGGFGDFGGGSDYGGSGSDSFSGGGGGFSGGGASGNW